MDTVTPKVDMMSIKLSTDSKFEEIPQNQLTPKCGYFGFLKKKHSAGTPLVVPQDTTGLRMIVGVDVAVCPRMMLSERMCQKIWLSDPFLSSWSNKKTNRDWRTCSIVLYR